MTLSGSDAISRTFLKGWAYLIFSLNALHRSVSVSICTTSAMRIEHDRVKSKDGGEGKRRRAELRMAISIEVWIWKTLLLLLLLSSLTWRGSDSRLCRLFCVSGSRLLSPLIGRRLSWKFSLYSSSSVLLSATKLTAACSREGIPLEWSTMTNQIICQKNAALTYITSSIGRPVSCEWTGLGTTKS